MARSKDNVLTHGLSGKLGDLIVFSQRNGETIVGKKPRKRGSLHPNQLKHASKFQHAIIYAKSAIKDAAVKQAYAEVADKNQSAYNIAVADFLNAPDIENVDMKNYAGQPGDKIVITATDDFKVTAVVVEITNADGSLVEEGNAVADETGTIWTFTATVANADLDGDKITIYAYDSAANVSEKQETIS